MKTLKRLGAGVLAIGVATAGMVMTAPLASAHNTMLSASSVCQDDGTYLVTYNGTTTATSGRTATLTVSQILPDGTTISGAPATVVGNTTYGFTQTVPGTATSASVRVDLHWTDDARAHGSAAIALAGDCKPPVTPVAPSGNLQKDCVDNAGHVFAGKLDNGTAETVSWRLVTGTNGSHDTVVAGPTSGKPLEASGLPDATKVWLQYNIGHGWVDEGSAVTTGNCTPVTPVTPSGTLSTDCVEGAGQVAAADLDNGTFEGVSWRLVSGTNDSHDTVVAGPSATTPLVANGLPDATKVWLQYKTGENWVDEGSVVTTGDCTPVTPVTPSGTLSTDCVEGTGHVAAADLDNGTFEGVSWRLVSGTNDSHDTVVAGPSATTPLEATGLPTATTVWLQYSLGETWVDEGSVVTTGDCTPVTPLPPSGTLSTVCLSGAGQVVAADLDSGTFEGVSWRLVSGTDDSHTTVVAGPTASTPLRASGLADATMVWLQYNTGETWTDEGSVVTTGECTPSVLGVIHTRPPASNQPTAVLGVSLAHTGAPAHLPWTLSLAALLLLMGSSLIFLARKPEKATI